MNKGAILLACLALAACDRGNPDKLGDDIAGQEGRPLDEALAADAGNVEEEPAPPPPPANSTANFATVDPLAPAPASAPEPASRPVSAPAAKPSFACAGTLSRVEALVCTSPDLAALDRRLAREYGRAMDEATPDQRARIQRLARQYLADRNACPGADCVAEAYDGYLRDLETVMHWPPG